VSRRRRTPDERPARGRPRPQPEPSREPDSPQGRRFGLGLSAVIALGVFVVVSLIAWAAGAANLGVALGIGQIAFGIVIVALMVWAP
jgi:hypothetical protein